MGYAVAAPAEGSVRCPVCTQRIAQRSYLAPSDHIMCPKCDSEFEYGEALPDRGLLATPHETLNARPVTLAREPNFGETFLLVLALPAAAFGGWYFNAAFGLNNLEGGAYLIVYIVMGLLLISATSWISQHHLESPLIAIAALVFFEVVGYQRMQWGAAHDLHRFGYLGLTMIIGGLLLLNFWDSPFLGPTWRNDSYYGRGCWWFWGCSHYRGCLGGCRMGCGLGCGLGCGGGGGGGCGGCG